MREEIEKELVNLEDKHDIKILYAVESGSRAWGFASTDSDWDVRYLYIHKLDWYLKIDQNKKDTKEKILPNDLDLSGWELKKALRLFRKSNPPMLEWLRSSIIYKEEYGVAEKLRELSEKHYNPKSCMFHYLSMAKGNFKEFLQRDVVKTKKYFYVLRPILACDWIKNEDAFPPIEFDKLVDSQVKDEKLKAEIAELLKRKMAGEELKQEPRNKVLNEFLAEKIEFYEKFASKTKVNEKPPTTLLDELFKDTLFEIWK